MPHIPHHLCYVFGPYRLDTSTCVLTRSGDTISLTPKAAQILLILVANAGQLVEKDELLHEVWPDTFVEESNLSQNIFMLRRALGDERAGPRYIETVTRRGYRFVASVRVVDPAENQNGEALARLTIEATQRPIVAVLPFINISGDQEIEYLADGVTENIINHLSRVSKLRVMSRSAVFRRMKDGDPWQIGADLGATAVLVGKINSRPSGITISVEFVDASTGWQLWGESFDCQSRDILEIQEAITRQLLATLQLQLTGDEEKRVTARYTENAEAYQAYLEGRYHWSRYTRKGIEKAIGHFRHAIDLDPNYALAYAGIVDCYLRLATNYLPPEDDLPQSTSQPLHNSPATVHDTTEPDPKVKLRFEWDWKGAERELRRANELKTDYPSALQWYAAYRFSIDVFRTALGKAALLFGSLRDHHIHPMQFYSVTLSPNEEVQVFCTVAREQIEVGNYEGACLMLSRWWSPGEWPKLKELDSRSAADLLYTTGSLAGCISSTGHIEKGQKHAEALLSGSIAIFEYLGAERRSAEAKIELALCYYRQGMFEFARKILVKTLKALQPADDLRTLGLIRLGVVERHSGHVTDSLSQLKEALNVIEQSGPLLTGRYHHEFANTLETLAKAENRTDYFEAVTTHFQRAFYEFVAVGHHRYAAVVQNSYGFLLLNRGSFSDAEAHLIRARLLFERFDDRIRRAQVEDTIARLYLATKRPELALKVADRAVASLELTDEEALLAEALTTKGIILCKLNQYGEARGTLEGACRVAERCGDPEGAGRALLTLIEEMYNELQKSERADIVTRMYELLKNTQLSATRSRLEHYLRLIPPTPD